MSKVDAQKALAWLSKGAQPSDTVRKILSTKGIWAAFKQGTPLPVEVQEEALPEAAEAIEAEAEATAVPVGEEALPETPETIEAEAEAAAAPVARKRRRKTRRRRMTRQSRYTGRVTAATEECRERTGRTDSQEAG